MGIICDATSTHVMLELHSQFRKVPVARENVALLDSGGRIIDTQYAATTPRITPMREMRTPQIAYGAQTPHAASTTPRGDSTPLPNSFNAGLATPRLSNLDDPMTPSSINVCQEIQNYRGREINEELDVVVPPYLFDRRILRSIELKNMNYLQSYIRQCPRNIERYFFLETVSSISPIIRSIVVSNLLGYAFLYRATPCVKYLLELGSDPFQPAYFIDWASYNENQRKVMLYEAPNIILISGSIHENHRADCISMLSFLRSMDVELHLPITLRRQQFESPNEPVSATVRYNDTWECWEKEIEKRGGEDLAKSKGFMRELKTIVKSLHDDEVNALSLILPQLHSAYNHLPALKLGVNELRNALSVFIENIASNPHLSETHRRTILEHCLDHSIEVFDILVMKFDSQVPKFVAVPEFAIRIPPTVLTVIESRLFARHLIALVDNQERLFAFLDSCFTLNSDYLIRLLIALFELVTPTDKVAAHATQWFTQALANDDRVRIILSKQDPVRVRELCIRHPRLLELFLPISDEKIPIRKYFFD
ncbi:unnamed protein product [Echinostoma caproni]|uniref:Uncharacterized protein n=1 Tax=Echinostoma caproni TaxID=27848 RepID=A0A3P8FNF7_9TREM|nr:unnamed protein product [Echinostoma caproni]